MFGGGGVLSGQPIPREGPSDHPPERTRALRPRFHQAGPSFGQVLTKFRPSFDLFFEPLTQHLGADHLLFLDELVYDGDFDLSPVCRR